jgi:hypothetical protein
LSIAAVCDAVERTYCELPLDHNEHYYTSKEARAAALRICTASQQKCYTTHKYYYGQAAAYPSRSRRTM